MIVPEVPIPTLSVNKLFLHVGTHKTGTTTIQNVFGDNRETLREQGLFYPDASPFLGGPRTAHHSFAHAIAFPDRIPPARVTAFVEHIRRHAEPQEAILLSSEAMYRHVLDSSNDYWEGRKRYLTSVARHLEGFDLEIVICFRRVDRFAESLYFESVSKGYGGTFAEFVELKASHFDYARQLSVFESVFPAVRRLDYEAAAERGLVDYFSEAIGIAPIPQTEGIRRRASTDHRITLGMAASNRARPNAKSELRARRRFANWLAANTPPSAETTLFASEEQRIGFISRYGQMPMTDRPCRVATLTRADFDSIERDFRNWLRGQSPQKQWKRSLWARWNHWLRTGQRDRA